MPIFRHLICPAVGSAFLFATLLLSGCGEPAPNPAGVRPATDTQPIPAPAVGIWLDEDPYLRGYPALAEAVAAMGNNIRVLHTGAHPDDEQSDLVAYLARGRHFRTAYLAANRGEGGQNGIGPEKGAALGAIRTEELLAARRIDGAEQYFLSKADFGFSKTAEETFKNWGHDETLNELVHFIRWYRPHVIVSVFSGTPLDGHGHHQAMGILTREAFDKAADPSYDTGQPSWKTQILYQSLWRDPGEDKLPGTRFTIDTGQYDPLLGKTYHQLAMEGRSQHRSQDMGAAQDPGPHPVALRLWAHHLSFFTHSAPIGQPYYFDPTHEDPFQPFYLVTWPVHELMGFPTLQMQMQEKMFAAIAAAQEYFQLGRRQKFVESLCVALAAARTGKQAVDAVIARLRKDGLHSDNVYPDFNELLIEQHEFDETLRQCERALYLATGVVFEVRCDRQFLTPGEAATLTVRFIGRADAGVQGPAVSFDHAEDWHIVATSHTEPLIPAGIPQPPPPGPDDTNEWTWTYSFTVPADAPYTQPQYLPMAWADMAEYGNHHQATMDLPPIVAHLIYRVAPPSAPAAQVKISTSAQYVWTDPRYGERREMVKIVPPVSVAFVPSVVAAAVSPTDLQLPPMQVKLRSLIDTPHKYELKVGYWPRGDAQFKFDFVVPGIPFRRRGEECGIRLPDMVRKVPVQTEKMYVPQSLESQGLTLTRIEYPHIRSHNLYTSAECPVLPLHASLPAHLHVGYIAGPGTDDELIDALRQMGATVTVLDEAGLEKADFKNFDTVFAGVRAYEVRPDLVAHNEKLLDWVKDGGTLIVLYQKYPFAKLKCAPAQFQYSEPHDRVTEEDAPVTIMKPDHRLLTAPNKITEQDFAGWHQDRGLYFFAEDGRDPGYTALLSCHDENEPAKTGGLLDYSLGKGHWVYCAYALHLQIPEAVPGGWRILANLAAYGRADK